MEEQRDAHSAAPEVGGSIPSPRAPASCSNGQDADPNEVRNVGSIPADASKLYVVTRDDLPPGLAAAQLGHALVGYVLAQPTQAAHWHTRSNNLVCLAVPNEAALSGLVGRLVSASIPVLCFHEPDLGGQLTAVAVSPDGGRLLASLPLALRQVG